jgi:ligand-binding sensor domain-containing protein
LVTMNMKKRLFAIAVLFLSAITTFAQDRPIGYWRSHLPYGTAVSVASDGVTLYVATQLSFFTYNLKDNELTPYSKIDGMSDVNMSYVGYDTMTQTAVLAYTNSNIDLFKDNSFHNIPDLKLKTVTGSKTINHIFTENGYAYLSTGIGVVVLNLTKDGGEVKETYTFTQNSQQVPVFGFAAMGNYYYAATAGGLYRANKNNPNLQITSVWQLIGAGKSLNGLAIVNDKLYASGVDSLFVLNNDTLQNIYNTYSPDVHLKHIDAGINALWISTNAAPGEVYKMNTGNQVIDSFPLGLSGQVLELQSNTWIADVYQGLEYRNGQGMTQVYPAGPSTYSSFWIYAENKDFWVTHGTFNDLYQPQGFPFGYSHFNDNKWDGKNSYNFPPFGDTVKDMIYVAKNPVDGSHWIGSLSSGLFIIKPDGSYQMLRNGSPLEAKDGDPTTIAVNSIVPDAYGNMWITQHGSPHELAVQTKDGNWYHFSTPYSRAYPHAAAGLLIDDYNQKWFYTPNQNGVIVYNDNYTIDNPSDDSYIFLSGAQGGIAGNKVMSMAKDRNGNIWVGTDDGISIFSCPDQVLQGTCIGEKRVVQYDQFAGYLFQTEQVNTIAVDGANRKWIGTNNGVWLISPEGDQIIYRFTVDNSPLPDNVIQNIAVDNVTGDVYISTQYGIMSYRSTATEASETNSNVLVFPNPVPSGYKGTIAIRGLVEDADVRITDISGQLIYRTKALGGQAVWNGSDYTGRRPQSGVYLIFVTNKDGSQTYVSKMVFMH